MNWIWEDSDIVCDEAETSPITFGNTCASTNMVNSSFRNKGEVKEEDRERLYEEINVKIIRNKRQNLSCSKKNSDGYFDFNVKRALMRGGSEISNGSANSDLSVGFSSTGSKLAGDIKYLLGQLVRNKRSKDTCNSIEEEQRLVTMNDVSPVN